MDKGTSFLEEFISIQSLMTNNVYFKHLTRVSMETQILRVPQILSLIVTTN